MTVVEALRGRFLVHEKDQFVGRSLIELGEYMEGQVSLFETLLKPSAVVVEVGANIGAHTVALARLASMVYAFEPQRRVFHTLCGNLALNELDNVRPYRLAGGERPETRKITSLDFAVENNFGAFSLDMPGPECDSVDVVPIVIPCDFLKIDVEGWETKVLKGSASMIRERQPALYIENDRQENSGELLGLISSLGYKAYWHKTNFYRKENFRGSKEDPFNGVQSHDILCLPKNVKCGLPEC